MFYVEENRRSHDRRRVWFGFGCTGDGATSAVHQVAERLQLEEIEFDQEEVLFEEEEVDDRQR